MIVISTNVESSKKIFFGHHVNTEDNIATTQKCIAEVTIKHSQTKKHISLHLGENPYLTEQRG